MKRRMRGLMRRTPKGELLAPLVVNPGRYDREDEKSIQASKTDSLITSSDGPGDPPPVELFEAHGLTLQQPE